VVENKGMRRHEIQIGTINKTAQKFHEIKKVRINSESMIDTGNTLFRPSGA
jgi:hypothetical protein